MSLHSRLAPYLSHTIALFMLSALSLSQASSPSRAAAVLDSLPRAKFVDQVAISPDGTQVAYIVAGALAVCPTAGGSTSAISVEGKLSLRNVAWSADSKQLVFLADLPGDAPSAQVWTTAADGKSPTKRAELKGWAQSPVFSSDGSKIAVLFIEGMPRNAGPLEPMTPLAGVIDQKVFEQRLALIDLSNNAVKQVTPDDIYVYEYDWTPDGKSWVASAAHGNGDANWWVARLYRISVETGDMREIYAPKWQMAVPRVSPDGKYIALIEGLMSDAGVTGGDIMLIPIDGGGARDLTPGFHGSPSDLAWVSSDEIAFVMNLDGNSAFGKVHRNGGAIKTLWSSEELTTVTSPASTPEASFSRDGSSAALIRESASQPPEVWAGPIGQWRQLTRLNAGIMTPWGETRNFHWMNGATAVQGWLTLPKDYAPGKKYPLVVNVHGGPSSACHSAWDKRLGAQSAMGYFVLCPNPRGSYGQGEAFAQGNIKDFGSGDYRDIMAGVDALVKQYPIDPRRIGIRGHSYGGYMTMWAEAQTPRFAAAVAGAGLSDWLSYYGTNDIDEWMIPFFGASVYDDPAVYAKSDPMRFVKQVKTPTLILVGDRDGEVPMDQSLEWWHALNTLKVPTRLVVYPNEGHIFWKPEDTRDYDLRMLEWFDEWFGKAGAGE